MVHVDYIFRINIFIYTHITLKKTKHAHIPECVFPETQQFFVICYQQNGHLGRDRFCPLWWDEALKILCIYMAMTGRYRRLQWMHINLYHSWDVLDSFCSYISHVAEILAL